MTGFETDLAAALQKTAELAPKPNAAKSSVRNSRLRKLSPALSIAATIAVAVGATWLWAVNDQAVESPNEGRCVAQISLGGHDYVRNGDTIRSPKPGDALGTGTTVPCSGEASQEMKVHTANGFDPEQVVMVGDRVWVREGVSYPATFDSLTAPVTCAGRREFQIEATMLGFDPDDNRAVELNVVEGPGWLLGDYLSVRLNAGTPNTPKNALRLALEDRPRLSVAMRCNDAGFEVVSLVRTNETTSPTGSWHGAHAQILAIRQAQPVGSHAPRVRLIASSTSPERTNGRPRRDGRSQPVVVA